MPRLSEADLRRPEFREGYRVRLGDGQEWTFPRPRLRFRPARNPDGGFGLAGGWGHDEQYARLRDALLDVDPKDTFALISGAMAIACYLLLANYDLSDEDLASLLPVDFEDPSSEEMWGDLRPVIYADPKGLSPSGSGLASSPTA